MEDEELTVQEFRDLYESIIIIVKHITDGNRIEQEVTDTMGGEVYETASQKIERKVREEFADIINEKDEQLEQQSEQLEQPSPLSENPPFSLT